MESDAHFGASSPVCGSAEGALDTGAAHGGGGGRTVLVIPPGGGKEPDLVTGRLPGGTEESQRSGGQGNRAVFGALAPMDMDLEARAIDVGNVQGEGFMAPKASTRDGGAGDLIVEGGGRLAEPPNRLYTKDGRETVGGVRAQERERVPVTREDVLREEAHATGAEAHGRGGKAIDVFAVQEGVLEFLCREAIGRLVGALRQQADCPDRGCLSPFARATALEGCKHVLTQWGHERSPF